MEQEDVVNQSLTVSETLMFASLLRLPARTTQERQKCAAKVGELIALLRLEKCADTRVGDATAAEVRGVSGGERKRLCIALELLPEPWLLFCDEPTCQVHASNTVPAQSFQDNQSAFISAFVSAFLIASHVPCPPSPPRLVSASRGSMLFPTVARAGPVSTRRWP